jgi:hypothetical protein
MASFRRHEKHILSSLHLYVSGLLPAVCLLSLLLPAVMSLLTLKGFKSTPILDTFGSRPAALSSRRATLR